MNNIRVIRSKWINSKDTKTKKKYNYGGPPAFKSRRRYQSNKNYCIAISIQKFSSIHKFILKMKQILGSHELTGHGHFWPRPPKNDWIKFSFPELAPACKKSVNSICSFLRYSQFYSPMTRLATLIFDHAQPKDFRSTFNLCKFVSTCRKIRLFHRFLLKK